MAQNPELEAIAINSLACHMKREGFAELGETRWAKADDEDVLQHVREQGGTLMDQPNEYRYHFLGFIGLGYSGKIRERLVDDKRVLSEGTKGDYGWYVFRT